MVTPCWQYARVRAVLRSGKSYSPLSTDEFRLSGYLQLILSIRHRRWLTSQGKEQTATTKIPLIPYFVLGFIAVAIIHNLVDINARLLADIVFTSKLMLGAGLVALGSGVRWKAIRAIGPRPMAMGMIAWVIVAGVALAAVKVTGL